MADLRVVVDSGCEVLVVHGAGPQMTATANRLGIQPTFVAGRRVTDQAMLQVVQMELAGRVSTDLLASALAAGLPAVALCGASGRVVVGERRPPRRVTGALAPVDFGFVADVASVDGALLKSLWDGGFVPILSSLVCDGAGQLLNLNADTFVSGIARAMPFDHIFYVADVPGVYGDLEDPSTHIAALAAGDIDALLNGGTVRGGMIAKLDEIGGLVRGGVANAWIVGADEPRAVSAALAGLAGVRTHIHP